MRGYEDACNYAVGTGKEMRPLIRKQDKIRAKHMHTIIDPPLGGPMQVAQNDYCRMTGPDCAIMCNLINTHTHTHTQKQTQT